jgi:hypothetical protein
LFVDTNDTLYCSMNNSHQVVKKDGSMTRIWYRGLVYDLRTIKTESMYNYNAVWWDRSPRSKSR